MKGGARSSNLVENTAEVLVRPNSGCSLLIANVCLFSYGVLGGHEGEVLSFDP